MNTARRRHTLCEVYRIKIAKWLHILDSRPSALEATGKFFANIAESGNRTRNAGYAFTATGSPDSERTALASSGNLQILAIPFWKGFRILNSADETQNHTAKVGSLGI